MIYKMGGKRLFDLVIVIPALILLFPVLIIISLIVLFFHGSPIFFRQQRPGLHGKPFSILKFRTMTCACDACGNLLSDSQRLTRLGRFLRNTSLDELPELINVLRGEMSLVGPRPLLMRYNPYFSESERTRFLVRPGITGLAQVSGRNDLDWDSRLEADIKYVLDYSLWMDLYLCILTIFRVISRQGLKVDPGATMVDFDVERRERLAKDQASKYT